MRHPAARALAASLVLAATPAAAEAPRFSCWDGSFAYTMAGLRSDGAAGAVVRITTQDLSLLHGLLPRAAPDWGVAVLDLPFAQGCAIDPERALFECADETVAATLAFGDNIGETGAAPLPLARVSAQLRHYDGAGGIAGHVLILAAELPGGAYTLVHDFGPHTSCDGWPDPFALP